MIKKIFAVIIFVFGISLMIFAGVKISSIKKEYSKLNDFYVSQESEVAVSSENKVEIDFDKLKQQNSDICAWLKIPAINLSYPVLKGESNDTYLRTLPDGTYNIGGSLFIDERCNNDFSSPVTIIYGHYMRDGSMFGKLNYFLEDDFLRNNDTFTINTPNEELKAQIIACFETDMNSYIYDLSTEGASDYLAKCKNLSDVDMSNYHGENIVVLSTCSHSFKSARTVVIAYLK